MLAGIAAAKSVLEGTLKNRENMRTDGNQSLEENSDCSTMPEMLSQR